MKGLQVKCTTCGIVRHQTTEHYQPDQTPKGHFIELIDPWKSWRWNTYDEGGEGISTTPAVMMCCPGCSAPLVLNGRLTVLPPEEQKPIDTPEFTCDMCPRVCKSLAGLKAHKRSHNATSSL